MALPSSSSSTTTTMPHALVLPYPGQGHVNPMLLLSAQLALRGCTITFVHTQMSSRPMLQSRIESAISSSFQEGDLPVHFVTIPDGLPADFKVANRYTSPLERAIAIVEGLGRQQGILEELIQSSKSTTTPISCIISDSFIYWTANMGKKLGIPRVFFWAAAATSFYLASLGVMRKDKLGEPWQNTTESAFLSDLSFLNSDVVSSVSFNFSPARSHFMMQRFRDIQDNACILLNSFDQLEGSVLDNIQLDVPIRFVGPLLPLIPLPNEVNARKCLHKGEAECLQWLDKQANSTVVYISFGSVASLLPIELNHLALGIEASEQSFLWVIRADGGENTQLLPEGFTERTQHRGLIISWAPQLQVLSHPAVGVFLTHCGWNSTIESIAMGVPMLCWPIFADQLVNSTLIAKQWKVGFEIKRKTEGGIVEKEEVERAVRLAMEDGEASRELRRRALAMKNAAREAVAAAGGSSSSMASFILSLVETKCESPSK